MEHTAVPATVKGQNAKNRLLSAGFALLLDLGVHASMTQILEGLGISRGKFYYYFESKDAFITQCLTVCYYQFLDQAVRAYEETPLESFDDLIRFFEAVPARVHENIKHLLGREDLQMSNIFHLLAESRWTYREIYNGHQSYHARELEIVSGLLAQLRQQGKIPADTDERQVAETLCCAKDGALDRCAVFGSGESRSYHELLETAVSCIAGLLQKGTS